MEPEDAAKKPPINIEPSSAPFELPTTHKVCPDCARLVEAPGITYPRDPLRPVEEFFEIKAKRYTDEKRYSAYCKPHQRKRNNDYRKQARRDNPPDEEARARHAKEQAEFAARTGYEQQPDRIKQRREKAREWRKNNPDRALKQWKAWTKNNLERRRKIARRSFRRKRGLPLDEE